MQLVDPASEVSSPVDRAVTRRRHGQGRDARSSDKAVLGRCMQEDQHREFEETRNLGALSASAHPHSGDAAIRIRSLELSCV